MIRSGATELVTRAATEEDLTRWAEAVAEIVAENGRRRTQIMKARAARGEVCIVDFDSGEEEGGGIFSKRAG